jgi:hypothetical protein
MADKKIALYEHFLSEKPTLALISAVFAFSAVKLDQQYALIKGIPFDLRNDRS